MDASPAEQLDLWRELNKSGEFTVRYFLYGKLEDPAGFLKLKKSAIDIPRDRLAFIGLEGFVDGRIEDRTAALLEPYFDEKTSGALKHQTFALNAMVRRAHEAGFQVALHSAGDRAVRSALDACQKSEEEAKGLELVLPSYPCRIEHLALISPQDLARFAALRAVVSMQPSHLTFQREEQNFYPNRLGARARRTFAWKDVEGARALLAFGSDWPAMPFRPRVGLYAATTRRHFDGKPDGGWFPGEAISLEYAVAHYTIDPARAIGLGEILGTIAPGKLADLAVFDRDLFSVDGPDLLKVQVDMTIFDGKTVFERAH